MTTNNPRKLWSLQHKSSRTTWANWKNTKNKLNWPITSWVGLGANHWDWTSPKANYSTIRYRSTEQMGRIAEWTGAQIRLHTQNGVKHETWSGSNTNESSVLVWKDVSCITKEPHGGVLGRETIGARSCSRSSEERVFRPESQKQVCLVIFLKISAFLSPDWCNFSIIWTLITQKLQTLRKSL